ncbi:MAG: hypothetical protein LBH59_01565 [Planctomycetaceae bacterium]|nr:hypothetical protein [Planctomycetaceae bacterium]
MFKGEAYRPYRLRYKSLNLKSLYSLRNINYKLDRRNSSQPFNLNPT